MTDLIQISYNSDRPTVLGRDLHERLSIKTRYNDWFARMCEYGFAENEDYIAVTQKRVTNNPKDDSNPLNFEQKEGEGFYSNLSKTSGGRPATDHQMTLDMAKQICMIQRTDEGRRYREYFLEVEKRWNDPQAVMARSLLYAKKQLDSVTSELAEANAEIAELRPKAVYAEAVITSETSILIGTLAKILVQNGININQNKLFEWMRQNGYLMSAKGTRYNLPTQSAMDDRLFEIKTHVYVTTSGNVKTTYTPVVTGKGQVHFINKFLNK